jgi:hypothetical protein
MEAGATADSVPPLQPAINAAPASTPSAYPADLEMFIR